MPSFIDMRTPFDRNTARADRRTPAPGDAVRLTGPSGNVYLGTLGLRGRGGIELFRDGRRTPCLFPPESRIEPDNDA